MSEEKAEGDKKKKVKPLEVKPGGKEKGTRRRVLMEVPPEKIDESKDK